MSEQNHDMAERLRSAQRRKERLTENFSRLRARNQQARETFESVRQETKSSFGADTLDELREIFRQRRDNTERLMRQYEKRLEEHEAMLSRVLAQFPEFGNDRR